MRTYRFVFVFAAGALVVGACGSADDAAPAGSDGTVPSVSDEEPAADPLGGDWDVVELTVDGSRIDLPSDRRVTVSIDRDRIGGVAACNSYGGTLDSDRAAGHGSFVVGEMSWTEMGCEPDVMDVEQAFLQALQSVDAYETTDGLLVTASDADTSFRLVRQEPVADAELVGTTWVLDTYLSGGAASNTAAMASAFLEFGADGTLTGSTGCRRLEGEWLLQGTMLQIPILSAIDDPTAGVCAPEYERLDVLVIGVVESGVTVEIDGQRLTLTAPGGEGLSYRAGDVDADSGGESAASIDLDALEAEYGLDPAGGLDGPVMYAARIDGSGEAMAAEVRGVLELDGDCLYLVLEGVRYPVLWPFGTIWDEAPPAVVLPGGPSIPLGGEVDGGGGYLNGVFDFTPNPAVDERAMECAEEPYREIAVLQYHAS